jgi:hypothetical protein
MVATRGAQMVKMDSVLDIGKSVELIIRAWAEA